MSESKRVLRVVTSPIQGVVQASITDIQQTAQGQIATIVSNAVATTMQSLRGLGDKVFRVLTRKEMQSVMPGCVGVGSPFIVQDPDTYQTKMLFTAWSDPNGSARELWIADIDEDLNVTNMKKIADGSLFGINGFNSVTVFWDDYNEQWVFASTGYAKTTGGAQAQSTAQSTSGSDPAYFIFFDKDWNVKGTQVVDFTRTLILEDAGVGLVPLSNKMLGISVGAGAYRSLYYISDYTARPLPQPVWAGNYFSVYHAYGGTGVFGRGVHQLFVYNGRLVMLSEVYSSGGVWGLEIAFGPEKNWTSGDMFGKFFMPSAIVWSPGRLSYTHAVANQYRHPHYTSLLGRPLLFYVASPYLGAGGRRANAYEIWAEVIDPTEAFDPRKNFPLVVNVEGIDISSYYTPPTPIPTFGARVAEIYLFNVTASGTLTIKESYDPGFIRAGGPYVIDNNVSVSAGTNKIVWNNPAPYIALTSTDVGCTTWMVVLK